MFHREHMHLLGLACPTNLMMGTPPTHILYFFREKNQFSFLYFYAILTLVSKFYLPHFQSLISKKYSYFYLYRHLTNGNQRSQYRTGGCTDLANGTIYIGYRSIPVYRFGFTTIFYYFIQSYISNNSIYHIGTFLYVYIYIYIYIFLWSY